MVESVITEVAQLTPARLTDLLQRKGLLQTGVVHRVQASAPAVSPVSVRYQLTIEYTPEAMGAPLYHRLFLRLCQPTFRHNGTESTLFYNQLVPIMRATWQGQWPFVECIDAAWSPTQHLDHLLLEDLTDTHFIMDTDQPPTPELCGQLIDTYAQFHAFWWEHPLLGQEVGSFLTPSAIDQLENAIKTQLEQLAEHYQAELSDEQFAWVQQAMTAWPARYRTRMAQGQAITLVHRDPHPGNILYPREPAMQSVKLIDWQSWRVDPGTDDLAYLIAFHWPTPARVQWEEPLLRRYHQQLVALGVKGYTWDDCVYDYRASLLRFITIMGLHWRHPRNRERMKLGLQAFVDWRCADLL